MQPFLEYDLGLLVISFGIWLTEPRARIVVAVDIRRRQFGLLVVEPDFHGIRQVVTHNGDQLTPDRQPPAVNLKIGVA